MLTLTETASQLDISAATLRHQVQGGRLAARLLGKTYVITDEELERYRATSLGKPGRPSHRAAPRSGRSTSHQRPASGLTPPGSDRRLISDTR
jgi:hypothetical protein